MTSVRLLLASCLFLLSAASGCFGETASQPGYPVPSEPDQVFFLQRSMNANTVVYVARFSSSGVLDRKTPIDVFWRRYSDNGEKVPLSRTEWHLAFGVRVKAQPGETNAFLVTVRSYSKRSAVLRVVNGKPQLQAKVAGKDARLISAYLHLDESGRIPRVTKVDLRGEALDTRQPLVETFIP